MGKEKYRAIVTKAVKYSEHDRMLTLFSATLGKFSAVAKGAQSPKSKFIASCQLFSLSEFVLSSSDKEKIPYVDSADLISGFFGLTAEYTRMSAASYVCELINAVYEESTPEKLAFNLLYYTLTSLNEATSTYPLLYALTFAVKLAGIAGIGLNFNKCMLCEKPSAAYYLDYSSGGLICVECADGALDFPVISKAEASYLDTLTYCDITKITNSFLPETPTLKKLLNLINDYFRYAMDRKIKSFDMLISG